MKFANVSWWVCAVACAASVASGSELRSPLLVESVKAREHTLAVVFDVASVPQLERTRSLVLAGVALPDDLSVDVELARIDGAHGAPVFHVDGVAQPQLLDGLALSVWTGRVKNAPDSDVLLAFSSAGCRGWIRHAGELFHLIPEEGTPRAQWMSERTLAGLGAARAFACDVDGSAELSAGLATGEALLPLAHAASTTTTLLACPIAVETDWQLNQVFGGNVAAQGAYLTTLLTWIAHHYEEQVQFVLTFPYVGIYTTPNDPWSTPDIPGTAGDMRNEFHSAWGPAQVPAGARFGAFLSGATLGGGSANLNVTCVAPHGQSATGNLHGQTPFPVVQGPLNWDVLAVAHELGHNFSALHTHLYCPPVDECAPPPNGPCQTQQLCISNGTIMSYCHLCPGGQANVAPTLHPFSAGAIRYLTEVHYGCLPAYAADPAPYCTGKVNSLGCTPTVAFAGHATLSGLDDFRVRCEQALNNKNGLLVWSAVSASQPFQGGTKCVAAPFAKSAMLASGGSASGDDCTGVYDVAFSHAFMAAHGWVGGATFYAQFWMRDPASPSTYGLSNGLSITVAN